MRYEQSCSKQQILRLFRAESKNTNYLLLWVRQLHYAASRYIKIKNHKSSKLWIAVPKIIICLWIHPEIFVVLIGKTPLNLGNTLRYLRAVHIKMQTFFCALGHIFTRLYLSLYSISFQIYLHAFAVPFLGHSLLRVLTGSHCTAKQSFRNAVTALFRNAFWAYLEVFWVTL